MNAKEALCITRESLRGPVIQPLLEVAYIRILEAARRGQRSVMDPFYAGEMLIPGMPLTPDRNAIRAALEHLRCEGYETTWHENHDPGSPDSHDHYEIRW